VSFADSNTGTAVGAEYSAQLSAVLHTHCDWRDRVRRWEVPSNQALAASDYMMVTVKAGFDAWIPGPPFSPML
jgi:hypothetical protein